MQGDDAAGLGEPNRFAEQLLRIAGGRGDEAHVNEVEAARGQGRVIGVAMHEFDAFGGARTRMLEKSGIGVEADHAAGWSGLVDHRPGDPARPAADVEAMPAGRYADQFQHAHRVGLHRGALDMQPFDFALAAFDGIAPGRCPRHVVVPGEKSRG